MQGRVEPKRASESATEMVQVVLPNDANPLGFILGGTVMHLIDIAGAIACHRHTRTLLVTAAVDGLQFLHPDQGRRPDHPEVVGDRGLEHLARGRSRSLFRGDADRRAAADQPRVPDVRLHRRKGERVPIPPLLIETADDRERASRRRSSPRGATEGAPGVGDSGGRSAAQPTLELCGPTQLSNPTTLRSRSIETRYLLRNLWPTIPPSS